MNLGIFGGSFGPVHRGHYEIVLQILQHAVVDHVYVVPAYQNPFKESVCPLNEELRWSMLKATFDGVGHCSLSDVELKNKNISYSYKTVEYFSRQYPSDDLHLVVGADAFAFFHQWKEAEHILELCRLIVVGRQGANLDLAASTELAGERMKWLDLKLPKISSTEIRNYPIEKLESANWLHPKALEVWLEQYR